MTTTDTTAAELHEARRDLAVKLTATAGLVLTCLFGFLLVFTSPNGTSADAKATIVAVDDTGHGQCHFTVEFTVDGRRYTAQGAGSTEICLAGTGTKVDVNHDPEDPSVNRIGGDLAPLGALLIAAPVITGGVLARRSRLR